jgi:hypothetical protein
MHIIYKRQGHPFRQVAFLWIKQTAKEAFYGCPMISGKKGPLEKGPFTNQSH